MLYFQDIILQLQSFWAKQGCAIIQPYDLQMGAGTFHPATVLRCLDKPDTTKAPWKVCYVQPCRRPTDSRYGMHPNRSHHYYQFQVILQPSPDNIQNLYLESIAQLGLDVEKHDIRFIEDDWKSPTLGAWGLGWEVWCNGMEVSQFTYMQEIGGIKLHSIPGEITYGLERLALYIQNKNSIAEIEWCEGLKYGDLEIYEEQHSVFNLEIANVNQLKKEFDLCLNYAKELIECEKIPIVAYEYCIKASHLFNLLDARGLSHLDRESYIIQIRELVKLICFQWQQNIL